MFGGGDAAAAAAAGNGVVANDKVFLCDRSKSACSGCFLLCSTGIKVTYHTNRNVTGKNGERDE